LADLAAGVAADLGLRRVVPVRLDAATAVPHVLGPCRPVLVLPATAADWSDETLRTVLWHELGHIRRRDHQRLLLIESACALCWFQPLTWMAAHEARAQIERACDDIVLASGRPGPEYARLLLGFARRMGQPGGTRTLGLAMARTGGLEARLARLLDPHRRRGFPPGARAGFVLLAGCLAAISLANLSAVQAAPEAPARTPESAPEEISPGIAAALRAETRAATPAQARKAIPAAARTAIPAATHAGTSEATSAGTSGAGEPDLLGAAAAGDIATMRRALDRSPGLLETRDARGMTPLALAAWHDQLDAVVFLIDHGAAVDARNDNDLTPLFCAIDRGRPGMARLLLDRGADPGVRGFHRRTLLHMAARTGMAEICRELLARGVDMNARDVHGETALEVAGVSGQADVATLLRDLGAAGDLDAARARRADLLKKQTAKDRKEARFMR
jgi:hypothetical protein